MPADRTQPPTKRRREKAREQGRVARSREVPAALAVLALVFLLAWEPGAWLLEWKRFVQAGLNAAAQGDLGWDHQLFRSAGLVTLRLAAPAILVAWGAALLGMAWQGGWVFAPAALQPKGSRLSPASNLKQVFSLAGLSKLLRSLIPVAVLGALLFELLARDWDRIIASTRIQFGSFVLLLLGYLFEIAWKAGVVLLLWSAVDYTLQYWSHERSLRMTRQEVRDELKDVEGNPEIRSRTRSAQRELRKTRSGDATGAARTRES